MKTLALLLLGGAILAFLATRVAGAMSTVIYQSEVSLTLRDQNGRAMVGVRLEAWGYDSRSSYAETDDQGRAKLRGSYQKPAWGGIASKELPVRLRFLPSATKPAPVVFFPLYYRFEVKGNADCAYNVFIGDYDYWFGQKWAGTFYGPSRGKAPEFSRSELEGSGYQTYQAVAPRRPGHYEEKPIRWIDGDLLPGVDGFECKAKVTVGENRTVRIDLELMHTGSLAVAAR